MDESLGYACDRQVEAVCLAAASVRMSYTRAERGCKDRLPIPRRDALDIGFKIKRRHLIDRWAIRSAWIVTARAARLD